MPLVVTIDTNIWVSAFLTPEGHAARLLPLWRRGLFEVVTSTPLLAELDEMLTRPRLQRRPGYDSQNVTGYIRLISELARLVAVPGVLKVCRDPDDDILLETAIAGEATHVVSRDEDIVRSTDVYRHLEERGIRVMTLRQFLELIRSE